MKIHDVRFGPRTGMGLLEVTVSGTLLFLLAASMVEAVAQVGALGRAGSTMGRLQQGAQESMTAITSDLDASGFVSANGKTYPYLFEDGDADTAFAAHSHPAPTENAQNDEPDYGVNREIVFVHPTLTEVAQDTDGLNWDLVDEDGDAVSVPSGVTIAKKYMFPVIGNDGTAGFATDELSYVIVTGPDGINELQRRRNGLTASVVARGVERLVFDTSDTDPIGVPVGAVRVRLWLRLRDEEGTVHRHSAETVVRLQNGG